MASVVSLLQVTVAWWLLHRIGEDFGVTVSTDTSVPTAAGKQLASRGGARASLTLSTAAMRRAGGIAAVNEAVDRLASRSVILCTTRLLLLPPSL